MQFGSAGILTQGIGQDNLRVRRVCDGIDHLWPAACTHLDVSVAEPTNTVAEQGIRPAVLWHKGSSGAQSGNGARSAGAMLPLRQPAGPVRLRGLGLVCPLGRPLLSRYFLTN